MKPLFFRLATVTAIFLSSACALMAQVQVNTPDDSATQKPRTKIILDTDIGDDVDDAFALGLALESPELEITGITTAWGDTALRARMARRMLIETGHQGIPVAEGIVTNSRASFTQAKWARGGPGGPSMNAVDFLLESIRAHPREITLVAIGPLTNIGAAIDRDPETFRKLKRVVLMGGSVRRRYGDLGYMPDRGPEPEYNIVSDVSAAQKLLASGAPIFMMPLDSTQLKLDEVKRELLFKQGTPLSDELLLLYHEWGQTTPTLFDAMAVAFAIKPELCPVEKLRIEVDKDGFTREVRGEPNASVCLDSDSERFFRFAMPRWMKTTAKN